MKEICIVLYGIAEITNYILGYKVLYGKNIIRKWYDILVLYGGIILFDIVNVMSGMAVPYTKTAFFLFPVLLLILSKEKKNVLLFPNVYMVTSIINIAVLYIFSVSANVPQSYFLDSELYSLLSDCPLIVFGCIYILISRIKKNKESIFEFSFKQNLFLTVFMFMMVIIVGGIQLISEYCYKAGIINMKLTEWMGLAASLFAVFFCILLAWLGKSVKKEEKYRREAEIMEIYSASQEKNIKMQIEKNEKIRSFKHDISSHLNTLNNLLNEENYDEAKKYIAEISSNVLNEDAYKYTGLAVIDAIIYEKHMKMKENNIEFEWKGQLYSGILDTVRIYDLCTIFSNILDNGIEACMKLDKNRIITLCAKMKDNKMYLMEKNKISETIYFDREGNPVTTKKDKDNHGIGSKNIRSAVKKYNGILRYNVAGDEFVIEIIV